MYSVNVNNRLIGVNFKEEASSVWLWAPDAGTIDLCIEDKKTIALEKQPYGYWHVTTSLLQPADSYSFLIDKKKKLPDPASLSQPQGVHGPSQAIDPGQFKWTDDYWINPPLECYIFYELHTGTYTAESCFKSIIEKIEHLKKLGINAIEIMPVAQFPGSRNWGYDGVFPFAVHHSYGGAAQLQNLVNACHKNGIAVVLDVVYNHFGPEGNYMSCFAPYFTEKYKTPWGHAINFDDAYCDSVRNYFIENALMWFRDFHIDALRLDAVHAIKDFSPVHILKELRQKVKELSAITGKNYYLIAECDLNDTKFINSINNEGYGMDAQWIDEFHHALRVAAGQQPTGYYSDFNGIEHLAKAYKDAYVYDGQYSKHRKKNFGVRAEKNPGEQFIVFSQNHDQVGNRMLGERTSQLVSFEMQKLLAAAVLVSPFLPLLFMGEEWGETHPFLYFVSHTDVELAEAVRKGRKEEFKDFHGNEEAPDPLAPETFERSKLQWHLLEKEPHALLFNYYQALIRLRKNYLPLRMYKRCNLHVDYNEQAQTLLLTRWHEKRQVIFFMNFSTEHRTMLFPANESWKKLFDSADPAWAGKKAGPEDANGNTKLTLEPESIIIYINNV